MKPMRTHPPEPALLILLSLASGEKHGHAMVLDIEAFSGIRVGPGSLYGALERLARDGLIEAQPGDEAVSRRVVGNERAVVILSDSSGRVAQDASSRAFAPSTSWVTSSPDRSRR